MKNKQFAVIGLGAFGYNATVELVKKDQQVLAIDIDENIVNQVSSFATQSLILDATDEEAMQRSGLADCDTAIISVGEIETSILVTLIVKDLGVPNIVVKCVSEWHSKISLKIGADKIIRPELEAAEKLAASIVSPNILEQIKLSSDYNLIETLAPKSCWGKTLKEADIRNKLGVIVIAIRSKNDGAKEDDDKKTIMVPDADYVIRQGDVLVVIGLIKALEKLDNVNTL
jgi:trk system potassium uptake protein TrkA